MDQDQQTNTSSEETEEISLRDTLESAFDAVEQDPNESEVGTEQPTEEEDKDESESSSDDENDESEEKEGKESKTEVSLKAPQSWKASVREKWKELPKEVQEEIHRRERDASVAIQRSSEDGKFGSEMRQILEPFQAVMAMENASPFEAVQALARTAATLRMGSQSQKANMIVHLMKSYGVDVDAVDNVLVGEEPASPEQQALQKMLDSRLGPVEKLLQEVRQGRETYNQDRLRTHAQEIQKFRENAENEFFEDVRADMADLIEMSFKRGQNLTLQEAYDRAIQLNPEIRKVVAQREVAKKIEEKRQASSSVRGSTPAPGTVSESDEGETDLRSQLERAWDQHAGAA